MSDTQEHDFWTTLGLYVIAILIIYWFGKDWGDYQIKIVIVWIFIITFAIVSGQTIMWVSRYYMPHVTVNNFSGSILGKPVLLKDKIGILWAVINTGEYLEPFHSRGKLATLIVPWCQLHEAGRNYVGLTFVKRVPIETKLIPPVVYSYLMHNKSDYTQAYVYFGKYSEQFIHENPKIVDIEAEFSALQAQINTRNDLLEGRNDALIEQKKFAEEMVGGGSSWWNIFKRSPQQDQPQQQ